MLIYEGTQELPKHKENKMTFEEKILKKIDNEMLLSDDEIYKMTELCTMMHYAEQKESSYNPVTGYVFQICQRFFVQHFSLPKTYWHNLSECEIVGQPVEVKPIIYEKIQRVMEYIDVNVNEKDYLSSKEIVV